MLIKFHANLGSQILSVRCPCKSFCPSSVPTFRCGPSLALAAYAIVGSLPYSVGFCCIATSTQKKERNQGNGENLRHLELLASLCPRNPLCRFTRQLQCLAVHSLWEPLASTLSHPPSIHLSLSNNVGQK